MTTPEEKPPSLPTPPFHTIQNISNLRDAAISLITSSGAKLRPCILFRSAEVSKLDLAGWQAVRKIGISHVFDLRSAPEVAKGWAGVVGKETTDNDNNNDEDVRPGWLQAMHQAGVQRTWTPVFQGNDYSPERLAERYMKYMDERVSGFVAAYRDILENGGEAFGRIFRYLASLPLPLHGDGEGEGKGVGALVHCTAGKDRTGMFFGVLFDFLGVDREAIAEEYNRTELGLAHVREEVVGRLMQSEGFRKYIEELTAAESDGAGRRRGVGDVDVPPQIMEKARQAALRMIGAKKESMRKSLEMLDERFGGAEKYMRERCGLGDEELRRLRENLVLEN